MARKSFLHGRFAHKERGPTRRTQMAEHHIREFLIKITKYCNLRCTYCNEYSELHLNERMSLKIIREFFQKIADGVGPSQSDQIIFIWHGGEPFLVPLDYYAAIGEMQREIFQDKIPIVNGVQTNLTVLTDRHIKFLKSKQFFTRLGISFDPYGDQRVDLRGELRTEIVLSNIQKLIDHKIEFGAITVLARNTAPYARRIYQFYDRLKVRCKFVPFYLSSFDQQISDHALSYEEIVNSLNEIFDAWISSRTATPVEPLDDYLDYAIAYTAGRRDFRFDREANEYSVIVNLDGGVWAPNDTYVDEYKYGDLSREDLNEIFNSRNRRIVIEQSRKRQSDHCGHCRYFGACPGNYVAEASPQQQELLAVQGCPVQAVVNHIVETLDRTKLSDSVLMCANSNASRNISVAHAG